ncbi:MAG TPA: alpha-glucan family phosphorylase [Sedimentisphaerales bacterium]|nr:alpha-glucan family phosphorylase [Sedimentisphaerales bacterium]HRS10432.1 alpha-glucan family phosphorylase [Sedimentisphaerales bacterium]HRV47137.1 alpha-glucan family phosphorylase [Sedimentisphaerales bacterium]
MPSVRNFTVLPALPDCLQELDYIARNMFWAWNPPFVELFKRIDPNLWVACGHNPVKLLGSVSQTRLEALARNESFLNELKQAAAALRSYLQSSVWYDKVCPQTDRPVIAYFSAEFGLHECLPIYSGGLGILAGDHLKSASDLGIPLVGVGLMYQKGYFRQYLNIDGWQQEAYVENDVFNMPMELVRKDSGRPLTVSVEYPGRNVQAQIWCVCVGRIKLYLLDTNIAPNSSVDRMITSSLYGGDRELRIRQEILLGIGGLKALLAMGIEPTVCHMNEGHAAFMALERIRQLRNARNMTFDEAVEATRSGNVFTVHTLVKAGLDEFSVELMDKYFGSYFPHLGINRTQFLSLGRMLPDDETEPFKMPVLAIRLSGYVNGVSKLHGRISREVWGSLWPGIPEKEVPIISITNGIHLKTWLSEEIGSLYHRYLGPSWSETVFDKSVWDQTDQIPDEELWSAHQRCKERLIVFARKRLMTQMQRRGRCPSELRQAEEVLDPKALTIGFARRFAAYKRGDLLLRDAKRLARLLNDPERPVQFIFAGKAHPKDTSGKEIIRHIIHFASEETVRRRIVFLEDYDMDVARFLVRGVDVWLNNPRRPMEASGTSGMKAAVNGVLNMSTLDGWWPEGYIPEGGWVIGDEQDYQNQDYQDMIEAQAIYSILENEVVPLYYTRSADDLPRAWIAKMKATIKWVAPRFNTHRMLAEYVRRFYNPAAARYRYLAAEAMSRAKAFSRWKSEMRQAWSEFAVKDVTVRVNGEQEAEQLNPRQPQLKVGSELSVRALVKLGRVRPEDVCVELYSGPTDSWGNIQEGSPVAMRHEQRAGDDGEHWFTGSMECKTTGQHGVAVRVLPNHPDQVNPYDLGLILWEKGQGASV